MRPRTRGETLLALALISLCVVSAVVASLSQRTVYQAETTIEITRGIGSPDQIADVEAAVDRIAQLRRDDPDQVSVDGRPGDPVARVQVERPTPARAVAVANAYAAEALARDRGVNREELARRIARLRREVAAADADTAAERRERALLQEELEEAEASQITDANFRPARSARRVAGPRPVRDGLLALPPGLLIALTTLAGIRRARQSSAVRDADRPAASAT